MVVSPEAIRDSAVCHAISMHRHQGPRGGIPVTQKAGGEGHSTEAGTSDNGYSPSMETLLGGKQRNECPDLSLLSHRSPTCAFG